VQRPGQLHVAGFTYVPLGGGGFGYTAFVIDAFAGLIAGWECSLSTQAAFVETAIRQATALRARQGHPISGAAIHHSDAGSQLRPEPPAGIRLVAAGARRAVVARRECTAQGCRALAGPVP
jgi:transposase InsO family protein